MRDLKQTRYSPEYQRRLVKAWLSFGAFWNEKVVGTKFSMAGKRPLLLVHYLCAFLQHLYEKEPVKNLVMGRHAILAVGKKWPHDRSSL